MGLFKKNNAEKEAKKVSEKQDDIMNKLRDERKMQQLDIQREVLKEEDQRMKDLEFQHKLNIAKSRLAQLNDKFTVKLAMELNNLRELKGTNRTEAIKKSEQRVKNYYYSLVVISRSKERLYDVESDYEWSKTMGELSNTFKLMNKIHTGYEPIKKLLFRIRLKKAEHADKTEAKKLNGYYNKGIEQAVNEDTVEKLTNMDPMDIMVSDDLVDMLMEDPSTPSINNKVQNSIGVNFDPMDVVDKVCDENSKAYANGEEPIDPEIIAGTQYNPLTDEEINRTFEML